jgi:hypothetical protein
MKDKPEAGECLGRKLASSYSQAVACGELRKACVFELLG